MLDVYFGNMDGVEVHAETPEEEQEAAFILNSALSGKTTFLGGCLCPSEADSTVSLSLIHNLTLPTKRIV